MPGVSVLGCMDKHARPLTHSVAQPLAQQQAAKNEEEELKERRDTPEEPETYKSERVRGLSTDRVPYVVS